MIIHILVGIVIGAAGGSLFTALSMASKRADEQMERARREFLEQRRVR